jgi:hypothetical protein
VSPEEIKQGMSTLNLSWRGSGWVVGYDEEQGCWWADEPGRPGDRLEADGPEELNRQLAEWEGTRR